MRHARNIVIVLALALVIDVVPGGGRGASVLGQTVSLLFLATLAWFAAIMYRQHRLSLDSLGDGRRALLYGSLALATLTLTATSRLWGSSLGSVAWLLLIAASAYGIARVVLAARRI